MKTSKMSKIVLVVLLTLLSMLFSGCDVSTSSQTTQAQATPPELVSPSAAYDYNWSGFATPSQTMKGDWSIAASWAIPSTSCSGDNPTKDAMSIWIGLENAKRLWQVITQFDCLKGSGEWGICHEDYPTQPVDICWSRTESGTLITAEVDYSSDQRMITMKINDEIVQQQADSPPDHADFILESLPLPPDGKLSYLPNFGKVEFTSPEVNGEDLFSFKKIVHWSQTTPSGQHNTSEAIDQDSIVINFLSQ